MRTVIGRLLAAWKSTTMSRLPPVLLYSQVYITDKAMTATTKGPKRLIGWFSVPVSHSGRCQDPQRIPMTKAGLQGTVASLQAWKDETPPSDLFTHSAAREDVEGEQEEDAEDGVVHDRGVPTHQDAHADREWDEHGQGQCCQVPAEPDPAMNQAPKHPTYAGSSPEEADEHQAERGRYEGSHARSE